MTNELSFPHVPPGPMGPSGSGEGCPNPEMLSAYLDGKIDDVTLRGPLEDHISRCEDCYFVVKETAALWAETGAAGSSLGEADAPERGALVSGVFGAGTTSGDGATRAQAPPDGLRSAVSVAPVSPVVEGATSGGNTPATSPRRNRQRSFFTRYVLSTAATLLVGAGAIALWRQTQIPSDPRSGLVAAVGARRFFDARLSGGFKYGERISSKRGGSPAIPPSPDETLQPGGPGQYPTGAGSDPAGAAAEHWEIRAAALKALDEVGEAVTVSEWSALASAHLFLGRTALAIQLLERAIALPETALGRASLMSDLSAAYLARGLNEGPEQDLANAMRAAATAVQLDPRNCEALFNRALAIEKLRPPSEALTAWGAVLTCERDPGWRGAAQAHLTALAGPAQ